MLLVVSPAKKLDFESPLATTKTSQASLLAESEILIERCKQLSPDQIASLMKLSDKLAGLNAARFGEWSQPFTIENSRPAVLAFNGDVYSGLDASSFIYSKNLLNPYTNDFAPFAFHGGIGWKTNAGEYSYSTRLKDDVRITDPTKGTKEMARAYYQIAFDYFYKP